MQPSCSLVAFVIVVLLDFGTARDLRQVTEPKVPEACTSLEPSSGDDTQSIQKALDSCSKGKAVVLASGNFSSGPLTIPSGVSLLVDRGVTLEAIPNPKLYDNGEDRCGTVDKYGAGCKAFISMVKATGSGIYGEGTIDGLGYADIDDKKATWWKLNRVAMYRGERSNCPRLIQINDSVDITLHGIHLKNSPLYHVASSRTNGLTLWNISVISPEATVFSDGIELDGCQNVTAAHCSVITVDDDMSIVANTAPSRFISIHNNHIYKGNGLVIGSRINQGISDVTFSNMTLTDISHGLYIRADDVNGGSVSNIAYENICMYRVRYPIFLDAKHNNGTITKAPQFSNISFNGVKVGSSGKFVLHGYSESHPITATINNIHSTDKSAWSILNTRFSVSSWTESSVDVHCPHHTNG
uniref:Glycoside hydrolase family 28 n=1 Tax=Medauroidea extradentata TaxID=614211 RepID=A0A191XT14_9NEOP|nr:glycoside hydrolase family 28 [Medauroidea extradentata]